MRWDFLHRHDRLIGGDMGGVGRQDSACIVFILFFLLAFRCGSGCAMIPESENSPSLLWWLLFGDFGPVFILFFSSLVTSYMGSSVGYTHAARDGTASGR